MRALNATLEARVAQRTLALEQQALALQRSNAELERFAYIASHDLQEPLRTITSFTELFMARSGDQLDARARHYLHFVQDGSARMKALIDDLLAFSRLNAERPPRVWWIPANLCRRPWPGWQTALQSPVRGWRWGRCQPLLVTPRNWPSCSRI
ncbi:histidine kinase dimerization/phospho-acceptor domain-containing protein [Deinococcus malanensis]|uniref:sensor histidine kinase n=1 Tax=Deinococcus malanensis TaxID=1706855 RepID=UPI00362EFCCC